MSKKRYAVIMAAGSGSRMGTDLPKQFLEIDGKMVLRRTIEKFLEAIPGVSIIIVLPEQFMDYWRDYCYKNSFVCPQVLVKGSITRFHSVKNALAKVPQDALVAIHDGVRPLLSTKLIVEAFNKAETHQAVIPVLPCVDTIKALEKKKWDDGSESYVSIPGVKVDRSVLFGAQTPQVFQSNVLKSAYSQAYDTLFTDDASVVEKHGKSLSFIKGERLNIKITTPEDLILAEAILEICKD